MKLHKFIVLTCCAFGLSGCATAKIQRPDWITSPQKACAEDEFCAVGNGFNLKFANADARSAIAKIFEAKISSSFQTLTGQRDNEIYSRAKDSVAEDVDMVLKKVEIRETYNRGSDFYALAVLNKDDAAALLSEEIADIDSKMEAYLADNTPSSARKLEKLYEQRRILNQQYQILTGDTIMEAVDYDQVYKNRKAKIGRQKLFLQVEAQNKNMVANAVKSVLSEQGYTFIEKPQGAETLSISITAEEMPFSLKGMVKFVYFISLKNHAAVNVLETKFEETGINEKQAFAAAMESLKKYIAENITELNL